jgi:hypothetical protein
MPTEIDELMSLDPLELTKESLDAIIQYHRNHRANLEAGIKPKRALAGERAKVDLSSIRASLTAPVEGLVKPDAPKRRM